MKFILQKFVSIDEVIAMQYFAALRLVVALIIGVLLVKLGLPLHEIAIYELFFFLVNFIQFAWSIGLKNNFLAQFHALSESDKKSYFFNVFLIYHLLGLLSLLVVSLAFGLIEIDAIQTIREAKVFPLLLLFVLVNAPTILVEHILLLQKQAGRIIDYAHVVYIIQLIIFALVLFKFQSVYYLIISMLFWVSIKYLILIWLVVKNSLIKINPAFISRFVWVSFPLIFYALLGGSMEYIDGFLVTHFFELKDFPIYRYGARELPLVSVLITAAVSALIPLGTENIHAATQSLKTKMSGLMHWIFPLAIALVFISPWLFKMIYSADFAVSGLVFIVYLLTLITRFMAPQLIMFAQKKNKELMFISLLELILNLVLSLVLLNYLGLMGIALATFLAYAIQKILLLRYIDLHFDIKMNQLIDMKWFGIYSVGLILACVISINIYS